MVNAFQQIAPAVIVIAAVTGGIAGGWPGGGHQILAQGRKEVRAGNFHAVHLEGRHFLLGVGGVEALNLNGGTILKGQDKIVAATGKGCRISGKIKDETAVRRAGDNLRATGSRFGKADIGHSNFSMKKDA